MSDLQSERILIITATKAEAEAVLDAFAKVAGKKWTTQTIGVKTYYFLGTHGRVPIFMVQSEMGVATPGGALSTALQAIQDLHPQAIIMCGIAFGLRPDNQQLGDILISRQLAYYEPQKVDLKLGPIQRGDRVIASMRLLDRFRSADIEWKGAPTHFGLILSGEKLVNHPDLLKKLLEIEPEAIGGEMEGAGLYAAASGTKVDWILVKAICDWGDGNKHDGAQKSAASNAAKFVLHVLQLGGWIETGELIQPNGEANVEYDNQRLADEYGKYFENAGWRSYHSFITDEKHLLTDPHRHDGWEDPFALSLKNRHLSEYYFSRNNLEAQLVSCSNQLVIGRHASGKTTIMNKVAAAMESEGNLVVTITLHKSNEFPSREDFLGNGTISPLSMTNLPYYIMEAFFNKFISNPDHVDLFRIYTSNTRWMEELQWFYQSFLPEEPIVEDVSLMNWLITPIETIRRIRSPKKSQEILDRLIRFVTSPIESLLGERRRRFHRIVIFVDETEHINEKEMDDLLLDYGQIVDQRYDRLFVKLFVDMQYEKLVDNLDAVQTGQIAVIEMTKWAENDLKTLLLTRPLICTGQGLYLDMEKIGSEQEGIPDNPYTNWTYRLVPHVLNRQLRNYFLDQLINTALRATKLDHFHDAPFHMFRLTRGFLAFFAETIRPDSSQIEVDKGTIDKICNVYLNVCMNKR